MSYSEDTGPADIDAIETLPDASREAPDERIRPHIPGNAATRKSGTHHGR
jgi:hypothetical protein